MRLLEEFWYGNIEPTEYCAPSSKECHETLRLIGRNEEKLLATMTDEQKELFSRYAECVLKAVNLGGDTDTTATVAGALAGLWYGEAHIPRDWVMETAKYCGIKEKVKSFYFACLKNSQTGRSSGEYAP